MGMSCWVVGGMGTYCCSHATFHIKLVWAGWVAPVQAVRVIAACHTCNANSLCSSHSGTLACCVSTRRARVVEAAPYSLVRSSCSHLQIKVGRPPCIVIKHTNHSPSHPLA